MPETPHDTKVTPEHQRKKEGEEATFKCTALGVPTPDLSWYNDAGEKREASSDIVIADSSGSSTLTIKRVSSRDAGKYTCKANNSAGIDEASGVLVGNCEFLFFLWSEVYSICY